MKHSSYRHPKHDEILFALTSPDASDKDVADQLGVDRRAVARVRDIIGMRPISNGTSLTDKLDRFSSAPDAGGHVTWSGRTTHNGIPQIRHRGTQTPAAAVAFERRTGRPPVGQCKADCDVPHCIADSHVIDDLERRTIRQQERALYGLDPVPWDVCQEGHGWHEHGRIEPDLSTYCRACNTERSRRSRARKSSTAN